MTEPQLGTEVADPLDGTPIGAPDRNLALDLARVTEAAALAAGRWIGRGDKESADQAAVDDMRLMLSTVSMDGVVVIGEGEKDEAPMLYNGEQVGNGQPPQVDVAVDPLEGTRLTARGMPNAIAVVAVAERGTMFFPGAAVYMDKIAAGPLIAGVIDIEAPPDDLVAGEDVFVAATGVTSGALLRGVRYTHDGAITESIVMRSRSGTFRRIEAHHAFEKLMKFSKIEYR